MKIGDFEIGKKTFVIAEIGGNHEGNFEKAREMVRAAAAAGADAVKFQILKADKIVHAASSVSAYSGASHQKQWERFKSIEFTREHYVQLKKDADKAGVQFMASVFDPESLTEVDDLLTSYKVASGDMTYYGMLKIFKKNKKPVILSTGASHFSEIKDAVDFFDAKNVAVLHCICAYPAPHEEMNLKAIPYLAKELKVPVGFSDHSLGPVACQTAVALGAAIIEKHFTLDKTNPVGDHKHSLTPEELKSMVDSFRIIEKSLGQEGRPVYECEKRARPLVRRTLFPLKALKKGEKIDEKDFTALRPLEGIPAEMLPKIAGMKLVQDVPAMKPLDWQALGCTPK